MENLNRVTLLGYTGREPRTGATQAGTPVTRLSVATNDRFQDAGGAWKHKTTWHTVAVVGTQAEYAGRIESGTLVFVEGRLTYRSLEKEIGGKRVPWTMPEIVATSITAIHKKENARDGEGAAA